MEPVSAILTSWNLPPGWLLLSAGLGAIYYRGWRGLHRRLPWRFGTWRLASFLGGLVVLLVAIASPLDAFGNLLLQAHMAQHLALMLVAPPLLLMGWPAIPLLRGLPPVVRRRWLGPLLASPALRSCARRLTHPAFCWCAFVACFWVWHAPALYELALVSPAWHRAEHACFVGSAMLFWWPVVSPYPSAPSWPRWAMVPYLLAASLQNTVFSAIFTFADRLLYPSYGRAPRLGAMTALQDQAAAGALMWVWGSVIMLIPAALIAREIAGAPRARAPRRPAPAAISLPVLAAAPPRRFDLLGMPVVGHLLAARPFRLGLRWVMLLLAAAIVADGLLGPAMAPMNLAGVLPWTHWRGLVVVALLVGGNFFCMACPFVLPRMLARRVLPAGRPWPRWLRSKWPAVGLVAAYLVAYEVFDLWASPWWTAWIVVGYFAAAFAVDGVFGGASFCKYVCPIGQFHFVASMASPLEVAVRDEGVCATCRTHDCIRGGPGGRGCQTHLFQPRKAGNLDCTFCLDCVSACPHDNVGILSAAPGAHLLHDRRRSSLGKLSRRPDIAALVIVLVFGAFANAAGMIGPVVHAEHRLAMATGLPPGAVTAGWLAACILVVPALLVIAATVLARWWGGLAAGRRQVACRFSLTLVPVGAAMWFAHFFFHLVTGWSTAVPVMQRAMADAGLGLIAGEPAWGMNAMMASPSWLVPAEITVLGLGLALSVAAAWFTARDLVPRAARRLGAAAPWAALACGLYALGLWIIFQPMEMRGTMMMGMGS